MGALFHGCYGRVNEVSGLVGSLGGFCREIAHLICHNCESLARGACPGGLDGGIEGQYVGLKGDVLDHFGNAGDLIGGGADVRHSLGQLPHLLIAGAQTGAGLAELLSGILDLSGVFLRLTGNLGNGVTQLLNGGGLLCGAGGQSLSPVGDLLRTGADLLGGDVDDAHDLIGVVDHVVDGLIHCILFPAHGDGDGIVSARQGTQHSRLFLHGLRQAEEGASQLADLILHIVVYLDIQNAGSHRFSGLGYVANGLHDRFCETQGEQNACGNRAKEQGNAQPGDHGLHGVNIGRLFHQEVGIVLFDLPNEPYGFIGKGEDSIPKDLDGLLLPTLRKQGIDFLRSVVDGLMGLGDRGKQAQQLGIVGF